MSDLEQELSDLRNQLDKRRRDASRADELEKRVRAIETDNTRLRALLSGPDINAMQAEIRQIEWEV